MRPYTYTSILQYEIQNDTLMSNLHRVESHKQELEQTLLDLKGELEDLHSREKNLLLSAREEAVGTAMETATEMKQAMEEEMEEREAKHTLKVRKLQADIIEKETAISNITK